MPHGGAPHEEQIGEHSLTLDSLTAAFTEEPAHDATREQSSDERPTRDTASPEQPAHGNRGGRSRRAQRPATNESRPGDAKAAAAPVAEAEIKPATRRRSRRASAPAATPGTASVRTHEPAGTEEPVKRFTADVSQQKAPEASARPTVVGVGVKAEDMKMTGGATS